MVFSCGHVVRGRVRRLISWVLPLIGAVGSGKFCQFEEMTPQREWELVVEA
jgi:hypothetical protein